jgi:hypothetical protein
MLICYATTSFHHKAFACCYRVFPLLSTTCAHACCSFICIYTTRLLLRRTLWRLSWRVRWFLGERATSQLHVETSFTAASTRLCYDFETFGHVINVWCSLYTFTLCFGIHWVNTCVKLDPGAYVFYAFGFALESRCDTIWCCRYKWRYHCKWLPPFAVGTVTLGTVALPTAARLF